MVTVGTDAGRISHHVRDVVLLVDAMQQVRHGALGKDGHVLPAVSLVAQGHSRLCLVVVVSCGPEETFAESLPGARRYTAASLCPFQAGSNTPTLQKRRLRLSGREVILHEAPGFGPESVLTQKHAFSTPRTENRPHLGYLGEKRSVNSGEPLTTGCTTRRPNPARDLWVHQEQMNIQQYGNG